MVRRATTIGTTMRPMTDTERKCMMKYKDAMADAKSAMEAMMAEARDRKDAGAMLGAHRAFTDLHDAHCKAGERAMTVFTDAAEVVLAGRGPGR